MAEDKVDRSNDVISEYGELRRMRDPRSGQIKEVDMSLLALSKTMEQIRKCAELINSPETSFEMSMSRFAYLEELVLDHAQFSPKLQNLQIRINDKVIEVVKNFEDLEDVKKDFARLHFFELSKQTLVKVGKSNGRKAGLVKALEVMSKSMKYLKEDAQTIEYTRGLISELRSLQSSGK